MWGPVYRKKQIYGHEIYDETLYVYQGYITLDNLRRVAKEIGENMTDKVWISRALAGFKSGLDQGQSMLCHSHDLISKIVNTWGVVIQENTQSPKCP